MAIAIDTVFVSGEQVKMEKKYMEGEGVTPHHPPNIVDDKSDEWQTAEVSNIKFFGRVM